MIYLLLVNTSLILCFLLYRIFLLRLTFFQWNRFYLLGAVLFSLLIPIGLFIDLSARQVWNEHIPTVYLDQVFYNEVIIIQAAHAPLYLMDILVPIYWIGVALMAMWTLFRLYRLLKSMQSVDAYRSFSFFSKVILGRELADNGTVHDHERVHVEQGHSYDLVLMELLCMFNWFNPVLYLYRKELKFQHECIADEHCADNKVAYAEMLVAHALRTEMPLVHEFSNHSFLKKRIIMLFKHKSQPKYKYVYLAVIPTVLIVALSTLIFNTSKARHIVQSIEHHIHDANIPLKEQLAEEPAQNLSALDEQQAENTSSAIPNRMEGQTEVSPISRADTIPRARLTLRGAVDTADAENNKLFLAVQVPPEFPGGMDAFRKWTAKNFQYPQAAIDAGVKGTIELTFVVERDGSLSDINILRDLGHGTGEAAVELLKRSPKWSPGIQNGRVVRVQYKLPITLNIASTDIEADDTVDPKIFQEVQIQPEFPGGMDEFRRWLGRNMQYPQAAIDAGVKGTIELTFVVEKDGSLSDIKPLRDLGHGTGEAAVETLKQSPKWRPGLQNSQPVRVQYKLPITLNIQH